VAYTTSFAHILSFGLSPWAGALLAVTIAIAGYRARFLTASGGIGVAILGSTIMVLTGNALKWWGVILAFFISASLLTKLGGRRKASSDSTNDRSGRSLVQVLANGGPATFCIIAAQLWLQQAWYLIFVGAVAAVNADTWATEIGMRWGGTPRNITNGRAMEAGESGGVTLAGGLAACAGALFVAIAAIWLGGGIRASGVTIIAVAGVAGALADSLLGATVQSVYTCSSCERRTESSRHCGERGLISTGIPGFNTHWVNFACGCTGALVCALLIKV
jgi:uncharacterized protein (TIGR00297 family)